MDFNRLTLDRSLIVILSPIKQEFFIKYPRGGDSIFIFNEFTGEAIYAVDGSGLPLPGARNYSHWFEPRALVPESGEEAVSSPTPLEPGKVMRKELVA